MDEARPLDARQGLPHRGLDAEAVDVAHGEHTYVEPLEQVPLALVEGPHAEEGDAPGCDRRQAPAVLMEALAREPERRGQTHAVDVAGRARRGAVQIAVRVDPEDAA